MNQVKILQIKSAAIKVLRRLNEGSWTNTTYVNLINECHLNSNDFYLALGWLAREGKITFFMSRNETYIYPADNY